MPAPNYQFQKRQKDLAKKKKKEEKMQRKLQKNESPAEENSEGAPGAGAPDATA